jgi:hypothetical protein
VYYPRYDTEAPRFKSQQWQETFLQIVQPGSGTTQQVPGFSPGGKAAGSLEITTHLHLAPRLRMSGAITLLPLYAFKCRAATNVPFIF